MRLLEIIEEDFINYKKPSMSLLFPYCSMKCNKEYGSKICHNSDIDNSHLLEISNNRIIQKYLSNNISKCIVMYGMEPLDSWNDVLSFIKDFRKISTDEIIIFTGYNKDEIFDKINELKKYKNIIIKYGRYIPNQKSIEDEILGVILSSDNQYAEKIS